MTAAPPRGPFRIGVDVGGTFTDLALVDTAGRVLPFKAPSDPSDPAASVFAVLDKAAAGIGQDLPGLLRQCSLFVHGSTIAVNTLLEKKGVRVGLLTTAGFRDSLEIRRGIRRDVWNYRAPYPPVLVPRYLRRPVRGRLGPDGAELEPLVEADVAAAVDVFRDEQVDSIAICLLHGFTNPAHEHQARAIIRRLWPEVWVSCSADVAPVLGEYERGSTTVVNAYIAPRVIPYLEALDRRLAEAGLAHGLLLMQSNGGAISVREIADRPVHLVLSGPAAGVGALQYFGRDTGSAMLMAIEVGGTSCDITLSAGGEIALAEQIEIDDYPLTIPAVQIHTVGAGGGTIARVDAAGMLHAGPEGAGARPGPAAYGLGGERPTVTDAQLVLGRLKPGRYAGGSIALDLGRAEAAIRAHVAAPLGLGVREAAAGIIRLVEQNIRHAVERVSIERGHNPRLFTLVAAGGAGPLHGTAVARALGCGAVYVPRLAGVFCAFGMCNTDIRHDYQRSWLADLDGPDGARAMSGALDALGAAGRAVLEREGFTPDAMAFEPRVDLRYSGQQWTLPVVLRDRDPVTIRRDFEAEHERLYGYIQPNGAIEIVNLHVTAIGRLPPLELRAAAPAEGAAVPVGRRTVWLDEARGDAEVAVFDGAGLLPEHLIDGPAVIEEATTTILLLPGDRLRVTGTGNYLIALGRRGPDAAAAALREGEFTA